MPFYLVIQTTLIEAEDENTAAEKAINQIRSGKKVVVTVKSDETALTHIVVPAKADDQASAAMDEPEVGAERDHCTSTQLVEPTSGVTTILKRMMTDVRLLMRWRR
jgi:hypothetical protein